MKCKIFVCFVTLAMVFTLAPSKVIAQEASQEKTVVEKAADTATCIMTGKIAEKAAGNYGPIANAATVGACTVILDNKKTIVDTAKKIIEKVNDAVTKFGERRAKEDAENPYRHKD
jgi:hypothetical protein